LKQKAKTNKVIIKKGPISLKSALLGFIIAYFKSL